MQTTYEFAASNFPQILIVEPIPSTRSKLSRAFQTLNVRINSIGSGAEALDVIKGMGLPDIAIVELFLPDMSGMDLATQIYKIKPIPIIMTAYQADPQTVVNMLDLVAEDFIRKPIEERELVARVIRLLPRRFRSIVQPEESSLKRTELADYSRGNFKLVY